MDAEKTVLSHGVRVRLRAASPELLEALSAAVPRPWKPSAGTAVSRTYALDVEKPPNSRAKGRYVLYGDGRELVSARNLDDALVLFEAAARFHVAETSPRRAFIHAGAVVWRGQAIVLPGKPAAGKTTLTAALVRAGAGYLSDEYAPIDERGRVHPFPKPLSVVDPRRRRPLPQPVEAIGGMQETRPFPVALVVLTSYGGRERRWRPRTLTPGEAVLELLQHATSAQRYPLETLRRVERAVAEATVVKGGRGDADETARLILARTKGGMRPGDSSATFGLR